MARKRTLTITVHDRRLKGRKCGHCGGVGRHVRKLGKAKKDPAHNAWLSGEYATLSQLAEDFKLTYSTLRVVAACEEWKQEIEDLKQQRAAEAYGIARRERIKTAAQEERAKNNVRLASITAAEKLAKQFLKRVVDEDVNASIQAVETCLRVAHLASSYSVLADGEIPEAGDDSMSVHDMVAELREVWPDAFEDLPQPVLEDQPVAE